MGSTASSNCAPGGLLLKISAWWLKKWGTGAKPCLSMNEIWLEMKPVLCWKGQVPVLLPKDQALCTGDT